MKILLVLCALSSMVGCGKQERPEENYKACINRLGGFGFNGNLHEDPYCAGVASVLAWEYLQEHPERLGDPK